LTLVTLRDLKVPLVAHGVALFSFGRQMGGVIGTAFLNTYLDHQVALNHSVLASHLTAGNPALSQRQDMLASVLTARGLPPAEATSATVAIIHRILQTQVATLSFNECFLAIALLFIF